MIGFELWEERNGVRVYFFETSQLSVGAVAGVPLSTAKDILDTVPLKILTLNVDCEVCC